MPNENTEDQSNQLDKKIEDAQAGAENMQTEEHDSKLEDQFNLSENDLSRMSLEDIEALTKTDKFNSNQEENKETESSQESPKKEGEEGEESSGEGDGEQEGEDKTIPLARLKQETEKRRAAEDKYEKLAERIAFLEGRESNRQQSQKQQEDPLRVIDDTLNKLQETTDAQIKEIWEKADEGELKLSEARAEEAALLRRAQKVANVWQSRRNEIVSERNRPDPQAIHQRIINDDTLQARTEKLREANPWIDNLTDRQLKTCETEALNSLREEGVSLSADAESTWILRKRIAEVAKELGFDSVSAPPAQQQALSQGRQQPTAQQRKEKIELQNNHPPATAKAGHGLPVDSNRVQLEEAMNMTDDQLSKLSQQELDRLAG